MEIVDDDGNGDGGVGGGSIHISVADVNADGWPDIASAGFNDVQVLVSQRDGGYVSAFSYPGAGGGSAWLGDVNRDGKADLVTANQADDSIFVFRGLGTGDFATPPTLLISGSLPSYALAVDLDQDNRLDVVTANQGSDTVTVFRQLSDGGFGGGPSGIAPRLTLPAAPRGCSSSG